MTPSLLHEQTMKQIWDSANEIEVEANHDSMTHPHRLLHLHPTATHASLTMD